MAPIWKIPHAGQCTRTNQIYKRKRKPHEPPVGEALTAKCLASKSIFSSLPLVRSLFKKWKETKLPRPPLLCKLDAKLACIYFALISRPGKKNHSFPSFLVFRQQLYFRHRSSRSFNWIANYNLHIQSPIVTNWPLIIAKCLMRSTIY